MTILILHQVKAIVGTYASLEIPDCIMFGVHGNLVQDRDYEKLRGTYFDQIYVLPNAIHGTTDKQVVDRVLKQCARLDTRVIWHDSNTMLSL